MKLPPFAIAVFIAIAKSWDKPLKKPEKQVLAAFHNLPRTANGSFSRETLQGFMDAYFEEPGSDLDSFTAPDFLEDPADFLPLVKNETIKEWGKDVHKLWNHLSRKAKTGIATEPEKHSLLEFPNPAVAAGDRFREIYYWDSFFIIQGLLVSGMKQTAKNVVENLTHLLKTYGHIPNGARTYYLNRSQPPLLSEMIRVVFQATNDTEFLRSQFQLLEEEHKYWTAPPVQVSVPLNGIHYNLSRYSSTLRSPRPESYREDTAVAEGLSPEDSEVLWNNLATAAASGWDFSSRWFKDGYNLSTCQASQFLPTDLNSYLYRMEDNLANFAQLLQDESKTKAYRCAAEARKEAMNMLMWDKKTGQWHDILIEDLTDEGMTVSRYQLQDRTYVSNWIPLWAGLAEPESEQTVSACKSFQASGLIQKGGVLTSLYETTQQWDAPNAWPPLQYFLVEGLRNFGDEPAQKLALQLAQTWLESNHIGYLQNGNKMVEKYNGIIPGVMGGGGEYDVQIGFGWTNGVMLYFLQNYGWDPSLSLRDSALKAAPIQTLHVGSHL